ncbi:uncharacterized protein LOC124150760 isoform X1 [Haliotis rufescens]|uniref:uncharacterized protein LOC124150760 isoform X2 n=1 Tax=Haliotis rufescens TaxID=6454 RepID=UPI00201F5F37|nr:uncharacterized protein LOC124150760 isoform X2 [Haliotis rufescens]XP_048242215.1 uncharacterized protein LOC124150760 isoform X1 [Haliotis rufescens]
MAWWKNACRLLVVLVLYICCKPVSSNWSQWRQWSDEPCPVTCGSGQKTLTRSRFCLNPENDCPGPRDEKRVDLCETSLACGMLACYECNILNDGQIRTCAEPKVATGCLTCMKSFTVIRLNDRPGETKDMTVESRLCMRQSHHKKVSEEGCHYKKNDGGTSAMCYCKSDKCNSGVRQGASLALIVFLGCAWTFMIHH